MKIELFIIDVVIVHELPFYQELQIFFEMGGHGFLKVPCRHGNIFVSLGHQRCNEPPWS